MSAPPPFRGDGFYRPRQLFTAITALRAEHVAGETFRMDADEQLFALGVAYHQRQVILAIPCAAEMMQAEGAVRGGNAGGDGALYRRLRTMRAAVICFVFLRRQWPTHNSASLKPLPGLCIQKPGVSRPAFCLSLHDHVDHTILIPGDVHVALFVFADAADWNRSL